MHNNCDAIALTLFVCYLELGFNYANFAETSHRGHAGLQTAHD